MTRLSTFWILWLGRTQIRQKVRVFMDFFVERFNAELNASLDGNVRRAIDIHEGEDMNESAFRALVNQAVALNGSGKAKTAKK